MAALTIDEKVLERILNCNWLANCGVKGQEPPGVRYDWETDKEEVIKYMNSSRFEHVWQSISLEEENKITRFLFFNHPEEYHGKWNGYAQEVREMLLPHIIPAITEQIDRLELPREIALADIRWNVLGIAISSYYRDFIRSAFYENLLDLYCSGHLPFGWRGKYPLYGSSWYGKAPKGVIRVY